MKPAVIAFAGAAETELGAGGDIVDQNIASHGRLGNGWDTGKAANEVIGQAAQGASWTG